MAPIQIALYILALLFIFVGIAFSVFPPFRIDFERRFFRHDCAEFTIDRRRNDPIADLAP